MNDSVPTVEERRQQYREGMIEDILAIAREMMQKDGVAALSFNGIARRLGMKPPSLYTYFDSKNAIYDELFRRGFIEFGRQMDESVRQKGPLRDELQSVMETYMRFAQENADLYQLMFQRPVPGFEPSEESMAVSLARLEDARRQFADVLRSNELSIGLPFAEALDLFLALQHGLTELHLANDPDRPVGEGRFGKLISPAVQLILDAWQKGQEPK
ncbi:MAG: TetR/AcrR family transcriptional regulator [Candidatus Promineifilaceae bacterium]|nr:TetR/AcrR family transcriptional regulator [Candidatus Promineifilaceae bacterium]